MLRGHTFVGMADEALALVQGGTRLFLLDVPALSRDLFYQQARSLSEPFVCCSWGRAHAACPIHARQVCHASACAAPAQPEVCVPHGSTRSTCPAA